MAARIGLSTGKEWVVQGTVDKVASNMVGSGPFVMVESQGSRVYIFRAHVAYVEDEMQSASVYEGRA